MKEKLQRFMTGRYGADECSRAISLAALICLVISMIGAKAPFFAIFYWIGIALMIFGCCRMFSRNVSKRYEENRKYLEFRYRVTARGSSRIRVARKRWAERKTHRFFQCPGCSQTVRVPKGKGKICISCPKCHTEFVRKS